MNQKVDTQGRVVHPNLLGTPEPPKSQGALVHQGKRPLVQSGRYQGWDALDVEKAGLNRKNPIGLKPIKEVPDRPFSRSLLTRVMGWGVRRISKVTREIDPKLEREIALKGPLRGVIVLATSHTGVDDPPTVYSNIADVVACRPASTERMFTKPFVKTALSTVRAYSVPDTTNPIGIGHEIDELAVQMSSGARRLENPAFHPSGRLIDGTVEIIGSNILLSKILALYPEVRIISVHTFGMNGSSMSKGGAKHPVTGEAQSLGSDIWHNAKRLFFTTAGKLVKFKRPVHIKIEEITDRIKAESTVVGQNRVIQDIANQIDPRWGVANPLIHVPTRSSDKSGIHMFEPAAKSKAQTSMAVTDPEELAKIRETVIAELIRVTQIEDPAKVQPGALLSDINLNSLKLNDLMTWVNKTFERAFLTPESFTTVQDVIDGASGALSPTAGIEWQPVSEAYKAQIEDSGPIGIPAGSRNLVDAFMKQLRADPKRVYAVDEILGEVTFDRMAVMISLMLPDLEKLEGRRVGYLMPNSIIGDCVELGLEFLGKSAARLNPQWGDQAGTSAMELAGCDTILTVQPAIRALKGLKEAADAIRVEKGELTQEQVDNDPTNTPFASIEHMFLPVEEYIREYSLLKLLGKGNMIGKGLAKLDLVNRAACLEPASEISALFTSGSEGVPKGIAYQHGKVMQNANALAKAFKLQKNDVLLHLAPGFHLVGFMAGNMAKMMGVTTVHVPNPRHAAIAAEICRLRSATITVGTPTLLNAIAKAAGPGGLSSLKRIVLGAEPLTPEQEKNLRIAAPNAEIIQGYGMTETGVTFVERFDPKNAKDRSMGEPLEGIEYKLVDPDNYSKELKPDEVKAGKPGVLVLRGPNVATPEQGFMGKPPKDAFTKLGGEDWFVTGDIVKEKVIKGPEGEPHTVVEFIDRNSRFSKRNGERIAHNVFEPALNDLVPQLANGGPRVFVVEGEPLAEGWPKLIAYVVPGRDKDKKPIGVDGQELTAEVINAALKKAQLGDDKFKLDEVRFVPSIESTGLKVAQSVYKKAGKLPHDGEVIKL